VPHHELQHWYRQQRDYYRQLMRDVVDGLRRAIPGIIVSNPDAALYSVVDVRAIDRRLDADEFVRFCAEKGRVEVGGRGYTLLVAPMSGFYDRTDAPRAMRTQMRIAYVEPPEKMALVPRLLRDLLAAYRESR